MKNRVWLIVLSSVAAVALLVAAAVLAVNYFFSSMDRLPTGDRIGSYPSPTSEYTLNVYLCNGGATVDYSIRGELVTAATGARKNIYWSYHEDAASVRWQDDATVVINGRTLHVPDDVYDFRR